MSESKKIEVKVLQRFLVKGVGQSVGSKVTLGEKDARRLVHAKKATFDLKAKTDADHESKQDDKK